MLAYAVASRDASVMKNVVSVMPSGARMRSRSTSVYDDAPAAR